MPDDVATSEFKMYGSREVLGLAGNASHMEQQIRAIERAVAEAPNLAFDLARTLIETVCKTILIDRGQDGCDKLGFKDLLQSTYRTIQLVPDEKTTSLTSRGALERLVEHLDSTIQGISDLRHEEGLASHGKDAYFTPIEQVQAEFAARAADAIVSFLYKSHRRYLGVPPTRAITYTDNPELNEYIDTNNDPVYIFDLRYSPSEVLFNVDLEAYRDLLADYRQEEAPDTDSEQVSVNNGIED